MCGLDMHVVNSILQWKEMGLCNFKKMVFNEIAFSRNLCKLDMLHSGLHATSYHGGVQPALKKKQTLVLML